MQNMLNIVMRRAGTDNQGKPLSPRVTVVLLDDSQLDLLLDGAGPTALMCKNDAGQEMIIPYSSIKYVLP